MIRKADFFTNAFGVNKKNSLVVEMPLSSANSRTFVHLSSENLSKTSGMTEVFGPPERGAPSRDVFLRLNSLTQSEWTHKKNMNCPMYRKNLYKDFFPSFHF